MTTRFQRFDRGELAPPVRMDNGWLKCEGKLARVGIQEYAGPGGKTVRELRVPEEIFSKKTMDSFHLVPVTATHPPEMLNGANATHYSKGAVGSVREDGDWIVGPVMVHDASTIKRVESGDLAELSTGYTCELDPKQDAALTSKYGAYDFIQRNILANHQALVGEARAGHDARVRLDDAGQALFDQSNVPEAAKARATTEAQRLLTSANAHGDSQEPRTMKIIRIDGLSFEVTDDNMAVAIEKALSKGLEAATAANARADKAEALVKVVKDNAIRLIESRKRMKAAYDAKKASTVKCDECDGKGKMPPDDGDDDEDGDEENCDMCDGKGFVPFKAKMADVDMEESEEEMDEDELETEQETEEEAGKAAKSDKRRADRAKAILEDAKKLDEKERASFARRVDRAVRARAALEGIARKFIADDTSKMDADAIRTAVLKKLSPKTKVDGLDSAALKAKFDTIVEAAGDPPKLDASDAVRAGMSPFLLHQHVDAVEEKEDGSHLTGYARMTFDNARQVEEANGVVAEK